MTVREAVDAYVAALKAEAEADGEAKRLQQAYSDACAALEAAKEDRRAAATELDDAVRARAKESAVE